MGLRHIVIITAAKQFTPSVSEKISIVKPDKNEIKRSKLTLEDIGRLITKYIYIIGVATPNKMIWLHIRTCAKSNEINSII